MYEQSADIDNSVKQEISEIYLVRLITNRIVSECLTFVFVSIDFMKNKMFKNFINQRSLDVPDRNKKKKLFGFITMTPRVKHKF